MTRPNSHSHYSDSLIYSNWFEFSLFRVENLRILMIWIKLFYIIFTWDSSLIHDLYFVTRSQTIYPICFIKISHFFSWVISNSILTLKLNQKCKNWITNISVLIYNNISVLIWFSMKSNAPYLHQSSFITDGVNKMLELSPMRMSFIL